MPRVAGQVDLSKSEAILDAALEVMGERGLSASLEEIARRARASKQTIYNHYGSKAELVRALSGRRVAEITAVLTTPGAAAFPERALADYGRALLGLLLRPQSIRLMRLAMAAAADTPDLSRAIYEDGAKASRARLARFLELEHAAGRVDVSNPMAAAEMFGGMVVGSLQTAFMVGAVSEITEAEIDEIAGEAALRFIAPSSIAPPFMIACGRPRESRARPWTPCEMSASHGGIRCSVPAVDHKPY